jgi:N-acetylmuramoyl-L-alanine amidase
MADYYAIPRYSQMYGIRGFIIEHGFLNHTSDLTSYLSSEESYKALGEADAKGIIEYLKKAGKSNFTPNVTTSTDTTQVPSVEAKPTEESKGPEANTPQTNS